MWSPPGVSPRAHGAARTGAGVRSVLEPLDRSLACRAGWSWARRWESTECRVCPRAVVHRVIFRVHSCEPALAHPCASAKGLEKPVWPGPAALPPSPPPARPPACPCLAPLSPRACHHPPPTFVHTLPPPGTPACPPGSGSTLQLSDTPSLWTAFASTLTACPESLRPPRRGWPSRRLRTQGRVCPGGGFWLFSCVVLRISMRFQVF